MKIKLNLLLLLFRTREHQPTPLQNRQRANKAPTQQDAQMPVLLALQVADAQLAHLTCT
ncbi:hypothetical protein QT971_01035 [Microcoleus sp. herbarium19]|uniref:hypothetical protein n=1 Tax=unclassified Microcoleus TaxID=2642155 RepID=UPI002FCF3563